MLLYQLSFRLLMGIIFLTLSFKPQVFTGSKVQKTAEIVNRPLKAL